jgi:hypothetical protein
MPSEALKRWDPVEEGPLLIKDCATLPWQPQAGQFTPISALDDPLTFPFGANLPPIPSLVHNIETSGQLYGHDPGIQVDFVNNRFNSEITEKAGDMVPTGCGDTVFWFRCNKCGLKTFKVSGCNKRTCTDCAKKRRSRLIAAYGPWITAYKWPVLVTLTLKREKYLSEGVEKIIQAFHKLRRGKWWTARCGVWTMEFLPKEDGWHVHLHCIADAVWIDQKKLSEAWKRITGDSFIVDVRRVKDRKGAMLEVLKYCTKTAELTKADKEMIEIVLKGKRFVNWFGKKPELAKPQGKDRVCQTPGCGGTMELYDSVRLFEGAFRDTG